MITRAYEFEIVRGERYLMAIPYDLDGGTQGEDFDDLCEMMADWLKLKLEWCDMHGEVPPKPTYGNVPRYGGTNMIVQVSAGRETAPKLSASEAARRLGVTAGRVTQLLGTGDLVGWREGRNTWIELASLESYMERRKERPAGRPKKAAVGM